MVPGKMLTLLWSFYTMVLIFAYQCNLRANLVNPVYEKAVKTHQDVLDRDQNIYGYVQMKTIFFNPAYRSEGLVNDILERSERSPNAGVYDANAQVGPPEFVIRDVMDNGALYFLALDQIKYQYTFNKVRYLVQGHNVKIGTVFQGLGLEQDADGG